jgi:hypothetical protein
MVTPKLVQVHLSQTRFASHLVKENNIYLCNVTPDATPYHSGLPINTCPESDKDETLPTFLEQKQKYQSIVRSICLLAQSTRPKLAPSHSFLSAYINKPCRSHLNAALYVLHYIHLTINYSFTFTSAKKAPLHTYMTFPHSSDIKAYVDAISPKTNQHHRLTTYSDACWGSQIGNAIRDGIQLPLFKFRSMSGTIIFRLGGPITWKTNCQDCTSLSSCKAEILATNMGSYLTINVQNMIIHLTYLGYPINDATMATPLYNDEVCVKQKETATLNIARMPLANGSRMAASLSPTSAKNATHPTYLQKKCAMVHTSDVFETCSCHAAQTFSRESIIPFINCPHRFTNIIMNILLRHHTTSCLNAPVCLKCCSLIPRFVHPQPYIAYLRQANTFAHK